MTRDRAQAFRTILLTGARGQLGHELRRELMPLGQVIAPGRDELDLADAASVREAVRRLRPTLIVNAGAYTAVDRAESEQALCAAVNADAPQVLAEEAVRCGAAIVHYSTDYVFDGSKGAPYEEDDAPNPLSVYGETKLAGERAIAAAGAPHLIFRTSWVYGARGHNFLRTMLRLAREREELRIVSDQVGAPTWSRAIAGTTAAALAGVASADDGDLVRGVRAVSGLYHLTSDGATSWYGFAQAILAADAHTGQQVCRRLTAITTDEYPTPARRPRNSRLSTRRLGATFGLRSAPWEEALDLVMQEISA